VSTLKQATCAESSCSYNGCEQYLCLTPRILLIHSSVGAALNHHSFALVISIGLVHVLTGGVLQIGGFDGDDDGAVGRSDVFDEWALFVLD